MILSHTDAPLDSPVAMPTTLHLCLIWSILAGVVAASVTAPDRTCLAYRCDHAVDIRYPFWIANVTGNTSHCGYPSLRLECRRGVPVMRLPSGEYGVRRILYGDDNPARDRTVSLFDLGVSANGSCPLVAGRNLTLPPGSPPPLSLTQRNTVVTFYTNCSFMAIPAQLVRCLETVDGRHHTYYFTDRDYPMPFSYSQLCERTVSMPVLRKSMGNSTGLLDVVAALNSGFELSWRHPVRGECAACERRGGSCGERRAAHGGLVFACILNVTAATVPASRAGTKRAPWLVAIAVAVALSLFGFVAAYLWIKTRKRGNVNVPIMNSEMEKVLKMWKIEETDSQFCLFDFAKIAKATGNFSDQSKLGEGGFGPVYKGRLASGVEIAIKRLSASSEQGLMEFKNEIQLIAKLQHRNLVKLLGCCVHGEDKMLIYEFMDNKSLDGFIFDSAKGAMLNWGLRFSIVDGIAQGMLYLHRHSRLRVIHRDLKASNVLLDKDMTPKISDFGFARIFPSKRTKANTEKVAGTRGYIAPEYLTQGLFSIKSDVFSFGVLLLEIISGKMNVGFYHDGKFLYFTGYAYQLWKELKCYEMVDLALGPDYDVSEVVKCIQVALLCVQACADDRPSMCSVVSMLASDGLTLPEPKEPAYFNMSMSTLPDPGSSSCFAEPPSQATNEILSGGR